MRAIATLSATTARVTHVCNTRDPTGNARRTPASLRRAREGHAPRIARLGARIVHAMVDDDAPELPDYDVVTLGPLEGSAIALSARDWTGGSDDAKGKEGKSKSLGLSVVMYGGSTVLLECL